jgi:glycosyltransferase involved in cell wall biosynthesis
MPQPVSVIVPAYNEGERLGASVIEILSYLRNSPAGSELIVVDDGSRDNTVEIAEQAIAQNGTVTARVIRLEQNRGKGCAVRTGMLAAANRWALFSDADLSTPITELPKLIEPMERGECDVAFGSRALDRSLIGRHQPWTREQGGRVMNLIIRVATGMKFWDTQCGFKAFDLGRCRPLFESAQIDRFGFDVELLYIMKLAGLQLCEIPVRWDHADGSKLSVFRDTRRTIMEIAAVKRHRARGDYDAALKVVRESLTTDRGDAGFGPEVATAKGTH